MSVTITKGELSQHGPGSSDPWIVIDGNVYSVKTFRFLHPGGEKILLDEAGTDASDKFWSMHRSEVLTKWDAKLRIGKLDDEEGAKVQHVSELSKVPYAEQAFYQGFSESPYLNESHLAYRKAMRKWVYDRIVSTGLGEDLESSGDRVPDELFAEMGRLGILAARLGKGEHLEVWRDEVAPRDQGEAARKIMGVVDVEDFDYFHEAITHEELGRCACPGFYSGLGDGMVIGLPPVKQFASDEMAARVLPEVLSGRKRIALAITEPQAGSDVANIVTRAEKTPDGRFYRVNGTKKWITQGHHADYFTCAVRTGSDGMGGISLLLLERGMKGLRTKPIKTSYSSSAGTALVILEDVMVPVENLIGDEDQGFMPIMYNFCHERWYIIVYIVAAMRGVGEECFKWAMQRRAFGKKLADNAVVRSKLAAIIGAVEGCSHWLDALTHQMNHMPYMVQSARLAGPMSLLKYQATRNAALVADHATNLFGGRGITLGGMGKIVQRFNVGYKFASILGGSEEVMADLAIKMAMRSFPRNARL